MKELIPEVKYGPVTPKHSLQKPLGKRVRATTMWKKSRSLTPIIIGNMLYKLILA